MGLNTGTAVSEKFEELEALQVLVKEKLSSRHNFFYERLKGIEEIVTKDGIKMLSEADQTLLLMARSHILLEQAVKLQKAKSAFVDKFHQKNLKTDEVDEELRAFGQRIDATITEFGTHDKIKKIVFLTLAEEVKKNAQKSVSSMKEYRKFVNAAMAKVAHDTLKVFDRSIGSLALVTKSNTFLQLQRAKQLLERASYLRKAIKILAKKKIFGEINGKTENYFWTQLIVREYNDFARKLEHLGNIDGPRRNLYGQFQLADIDRYLGEKKRDEKRKLVKGQEEDLWVMDSDFWRLIRRLVHDYNLLGLPQMDEVKIRGFGHIVLCIGQIEYDYVKGEVRRRKFDEEKDEYTAEGSLGKATPLANTGLVKVADADRIFFQMVQHGWDGQSYNMKENRYCGTFVWNFLCQLFGQCPSEEKMPSNFMSVDEMVPIGSVFSHPEFVIPNERKYASENCKLKHHEIKLQFIGNDSERGIEFPPIVEYTTGIYYGDGHFPLTKSFSIQEQMEEVAEEDNKSESATDHPKQRRFSAKVLAYVCEGKDGKEFSYVEY